MFAAILYNTLDYRLYYVTYLGISCAYLHCDISVKILGINFHAIGFLTKILWKQHWSDTDFNDALVDDDAYLDLISRNIAIWGNDPRSQEK